MPWVTPGSPTLQHHRPPIHRVLSRPGPGLRAAQLPPVEGLRDHRPRDLQEDARRPLSVLRAVPLGAAGARGSAASAPSCYLFPRSQVRSLVHSQAAPLSPEHWERAPCPAHPAPTTARPVASLTPFQLATC